MVNKNISIILIGMVIVLVALNVFLFLNQPTAGESIETDKSLVLAKQFGNNAHEAIQKILTEAKTLELPESQKTNEKSKALLESLNSEIEWIALKETALNRQINSTKSIETATSLSEQEVALLIFTNFAISINEETLKQLNSNRENTINETSKIIDSIKVSNFLQNELIPDSNEIPRASSQKIQENFYNLMAEFTLEKKRQFLQEQNLDKKFIEAIKLLELNSLYSLAQN